MCCDVRPRLRFGHCCRCCSTSQPEDANARHAALLAFEGIHRRINSSGLLKELCVETYSTELLRTLLLQRGYERAPLECRVRAPHLSGGQVRAQVEAEQPRAAAEADPAPSIAPRLA